MNRLRKGKQINCSVYLKGSVVLVYVYFFPCLVKHGDLYISFGFIWF
jgi:hypothetical protein